MTAVKRALASALTQRTTTMIGQTTDHERHDLLAWAKRNDAPGLIPEQRAAARFIIDTLEPGVDEDLHSRILEVFETYLKGNAEAEAEMALLAARAKGMEEKLCLSSDAFLYSSGECQRLISERNFARTETEQVENDLREIADALGCGPVDDVLETAKKRQAEVVRLTAVPVPRVITEPEELEKLCKGSIIMDGFGESCDVVGPGSVRSHGKVFTSSEILERGEVTLLWEVAA